MTPADLIACKRDGGILPADEIAKFIAGYSQGKIPEYQMSALAMAIYLQGMDHRETAALTESMLQSGTPLRWSPEDQPLVDKHSTGGIGDKISIVLAPLLACCEVRVPMLSGRGLGATGGTLDKLEAIPGFRTDLSQEEIQRITREVGCVITGTTADIAPADRQLYALRDVTATVASIPLITASILSKKLSESLDALVLDVKYGSGAFMKTSDRARMLARSLVDTGSLLGVRVKALITDMNQPLGQMIGNSVEVDEAVATLQGEGPSDLVELSIQLGAELLVLAQRADQLQEATDKLRAVLDSGQGYEKLREMCAAQGGDLNASRKIAPQHTWHAKREGVLIGIDAETLGKIIIQLGGGRVIKTDGIDHSVGLQFLPRLGERVDVGQALVNIFAPRDSARQIEPLLERCLEISDEPREPRSLVLERL